MDNENIYYVYEWIRLDTNEPFYVGKGKNYRWKQIHRDYNPHFTNIVKSIPVVVHILHNNLSEDEANEYECWYINEYKYNIGYDLTNITDGGEGVSGYKHAEEDLKQNRMRIHGFDIEDFKDEIINMYINKNMSTHKIGEHFEVSDVCISRVLKKFSIPLKSAKDFNAKLTGLTRYNSKCILVKDVNNNVVNCFESLALCGEWVSGIGLVNNTNGGKKAVRKNIDTNINYKGLLFYNISKDEFNKYLFNKNKFVKYKVNEVNKKSLSNSSVIEVYDKNNKLITTHSSLNECANWLVDQGVTTSSSSASDAIYRNINGKFYKNTFTFKKYSKSEYNKLVQSA